MAFVTDLDNKILELIDARPGINLITISKTLNVTPPNVSKKLFRFTRGGFLNCVENQKNRTEKLYTITPKGKMMMQYLSDINGKDMGKE